ncbi:MAG TPA: amidohydrolase, partial [Aggregatilineales bacterium]|nr:amidohydrolase [Aggregatilineales bacterium]
MMASRMQVVDYLLRGGTVLTMNEQMDIFMDGAVAIADDSIVAVGGTSMLERTYRAREVIDCTGKIIMPGLVNAHTHVPMTLLRGMADDLRLEVWLMGYVMPTEQQFVNEEFCYLGTKLACAEMIRAGTTLFADMYYFEDVVAQATSEAGIRGVLGQSVLKFPSPDSESWQQTLLYTENFINIWKGHPLIVPAVAPHAPYTCTDEILQACADLARRYDVPLHIHISETRFEVDRSLQEHGSTVLWRVDKVGVLDTKCICAHCVHIDTEEIKLAARKKVGIVHNPSSNMKLASGLAPVAQMLAEGCKVGIGTDGPASNNDLDMVSELHLASLMGKVQTGDPT